MSFTGVDCVCVLPDVSFCGVLVTGVGSSFPAFCEDLVTGVVCASFVPDLSFCGVLATCVDCASSLANVSFCGVLV